MKKFTLLLIFASLLPAILHAESPLPADSTVKAPSEKYLKYLDYAEEAIKDSRWSDAETYFLEAARLEPGNPTNILLMSNIGMMRHYDGRDSLALVMLDAAERIAPSSVTVRSNRATVLAALGRLDEAKAEHSTIISLDSTLVEPRFMRAIISLRQGLVDSVRTDVDYMLIHFPDESDTWTAAAYLDIALGKYQEAIPFLNKIIDSNPLPSDYGERALCYLMTDNLNEASADLAEAIRLDPLNGDFFLYRALLNKRRYRLSEAAEDTRRAASLGVSPSKIALLNL
ncbi:MAG: hypothetical protein NC043_08510 [Muribaculaceae bacterium]|nr:hypothetical protein [Muribaculaceae bacterium]